MSFPDIDAPQRTNESFRNKVDIEHHSINKITNEVEISPLEELPQLDMITNFPIGDSLHLIDLGSKFVYI